MEKNTTQVRRLFLTVLLAFDSSISGSAKRDAVVRSDLIVQVRR